MGITRKRRKDFTAHGLYMKVGGDISFGIIHHKITESLFLFAFHYTLLHPFLRFWCFLLFTPQLWGEE